jgi:hypothetical protein
MGVHLGGERRIITCGCGWTAKGHPNRLDTIFRLHKKKCESAQQDDVPSKTAFKTGENALNNIRVSKNGNHYIAPHNDSVRQFTY